MRIGVCSMHTNLGHIARFSTHQRHSAGENSGLVRIGMGGMHTNLVRIAGFSMHQKHSAGEN